MKGAVVVEMGPADVIGKTKQSDFERRVREKQAVYTAAYRSGPQVTASGEAERQARVDAPLKQIPTKPAGAGRGPVVPTAPSRGVRLLTRADHSAALVTGGGQLLRAVP